MVVCIQASRCVTVLLCCAHPAPHCEHVKTLFDGAQVPSASVFDDFGRVALGRLGQWLVYLTVYLTVFTEPIVFHLTRCTERSPWDVSTVFQRHACAMSWSIHKHVLTACRCMVQKAVFYNTVAWCGKSWNAHL